MCTLIEKISGTSPIASVPVSELVACILKPGTEGRLLLPPIQRSFVWTNAQVINYWDSLLRGYPAGLMMVHSAENPENPPQGRDQDDHTCYANPSDFQLFDGQQRIKAILLGLAEGLLAKSRRLWIDIGKKPNQQSGLIFQLRISSAGQPFGYQPDAPNSKFDLKKRTQQWKKWETSNNCRNPVHAFQNATGRDLIDAICAVPFADIGNAVREGDPEQAIRLLRESVNAQCPDINADESITDFVAAVQIAMNSMVIVQKVDEEIVNDQHEYVRFFTRLGQGGTRLSDDELTYSIIKHHYPTIHDRIRAIMDNSGRLGGEVDLVLGALRVAKTLAPWPQAKEWEIIGRPNPAFVEQLALDESLTGVGGKFAELIPLDNHPGTGPLEDALLGLRRALSFDATQAADTGFPAMLLARLPRDLLDVLMLLAIKRGADQTWPAEDRNRLRAFVLYWMLFVRDDYKAAWLVFRKISDAANGQPWHFDQGSLRDLIEEYEREEIARALPRIGDLQELRDEVAHENAQLRSWSQRFTSCDEDHRRKPGEALRVLSTHSELIRRALMWLQRKYISNEFPNYDPTSDRDDDLPLDLDHLIPQNVFDFDWRWRDNRLAQEGVDLDNFRAERRTIGNSLGNYRWLTARDNRERQDGEINERPNDADLNEEWEPWNALINTQPWQNQDVSSFQRLIDERTLRLYEILLTQSGVQDILLAPPG